MKKIIFLVICTLAISTAAFAGCSGTNAADRSATDGNYNLVQDSEENKQPSESQFIRPEPRTPHADRRTSDDGNCEDGNCDDNDCEDGDCDEDKKECPDCKPRTPHKRRKPHGGLDKIPAPHRLPIQPKN